MSTPPASKNTRARSSSSSSPSSGRCLHPCPSNEWPAHWGDPSIDETVTPLAGPGAPLVAEFAPADLAAALNITLDAGRQLIADGLELTYRLPRLFDLTRSGVVPVWVARAISRETHDLSVEAVAFADRLISSTPDKIHQVDATQLVEEARLYYDPDRAIADEEHELARRGVWVKHRGNPATTDVVMTLDTPDALRFHETVTILAAELHAYGDTDPVDVRRARAVGILADPQYALNLLDGHPRRHTHHGSGAGMNLFVHLTPEDLTGEGTGAVSVEKLGAATTQLLADWLAGYAATGGKVILRPVLDLTDSRAVDQHDPPTALRERCILRDPHCVFPGCRRDSRSCDLDHIVAYIPMTRRATGPNERREPRALVPHPSPDQDPHRLGLQTPHRRHLHLDLPHRTPIRRHPRLPASTTTKNLTPPHPGPPQPGTSARPDRSQAQKKVLIQWFRDAR